MRLADFIEDNAESILNAAEAFASEQLPAGAHLDALALRDHLPLVLEAIVDDLRSPQTAQQEALKSAGRAPVDADAASTAAQVHATFRAKAGFQIEQLVAEYRALRASVLRLWVAQRGSLDLTVIEDIARFNEAIDQAVAESVAEFVAEADRWRHVFLAVLGHDLRGPLTAVLTTAQLLEKLGNGAPVTKYTAQLIRGGRRMQQLLDSLLDYSRSSLGQGIAISRVETDLAQACSEEVDILSATFPGHSISLHLAGPTSGFYDASRIREALNNLVSNAARYARDSAVRVALEADVQTIRLSVENDGKALAQDELNALFEPLRRGREDGLAATAARTNLGLGLFIAQEIARAHGGGVEAASSGGKTTFTVTLPAAQSASPSPG